MTEHMSEEAPLEAQLSLATLRDLVGLQVAVVLREIVKHLERTLRDSVALQTPAKYEDSG